MPPFRMTKAPVPDSPAKRVDARFHCEPLPVIVQKTGGGYLYATTDLAAIRYRCHELHAERVLYVVDARQSLHFQQVFRVAQLAGFAGERVPSNHDGKCPVGIVIVVNGQTNLLEIVLAL